MSALPPKADILGGGVDVRFVPKADIAALTVSGGWSGVRHPSRCCADIIGHVFAMPDSDKVNDVGDLLS